MADDDVVPPTGGKPEDLPPTGWMETMDASNQVVRRMHEAARRRAVAATTAVAYTPLPLRASNATLAGEGSLSANARVVTAVGDTRRRVEFAQQLSEHPVEIRDAARALAQAVRDQITELAAARRNDTETADFIEFLEMVARELDRLVDALDRAIKGSADQQPMFLGEAGKIADQLKTAFDEALPSIAQFSIKIGVVAAGAIFLQHICGLDPNIAAVTSILNATFPQKKSN
jgi:hypothetical protein